MIAPLPFPDRDVTLWQDSQEHQQFITSDYVVNKRDTYVIVPATASGSINITLDASRNGRKLSIINFSLSADVTVIGDIYNYASVKVYPNDLLFLKVIGDKYAGWSFSLISKNLPSVLPDIISQITTTVSSATYNIVETYGNLNFLCNTTSTSILVNLPTAVSNKAEMTFKKIASANTLTIDPFGTETIDDGLTAAWTRKDESITIYSDGANWRIK
jgi:hypothetical protein